MFKRMVVCLYVWHCKNEIGCVQACGAHSRCPGSISLALLRRLEKGVDFSKKDFSSFGKCARVS